MGFRIVPGYPGPGDVPGNPSRGQYPSSMSHNAPAANTAAVVTLAASSGQAYRLTLLAYSYSASPTGGRVTIADGVSTVFDLDVTSTWEVLTHLTPGGILITSGNACTITLAAGGAGISGKLNVGYLLA